MNNFLIFILLICRQLYSNGQCNVKEMIKLEEILFFSNGKNLDAIVTTYFEKVHYGQKTSDPLFPRRINLSLKNDFYSNVSFCSLSPTKIYGYYQSVDSLAFYLLVSVETNVKDSIDKVLGLPEYISELSAENTQMMNNSLYNWRMNKYEIYLRRNTGLNERKDKREFYLITITSIPLSDLFFLEQLNR